MRLGAPDGSLYERTGICSLELILALSVLVVPAVSAGLAAQSADGSLTIWQLRSRLAEMEKNLPIVYAGSAVAKKKSEIAAELEKYVREELVNAMNSLSCKFLYLVDLFVGCAAVVYLVELNILQLLTMSN